MIGKKNEVHVKKFGHNGHKLHKIGQMPLWRVNIKWA